MKKLILSAAALLMAAPMFLLSAQNEEKEMKTGWSFGVLPTATFSVDNGFQAGAFGDVYYYGDGNTYPDPLHKISWEASYFTKSQRMRLYLAYDSKYLIPRMRINASVTYVNDPLYSFWGFNGPSAIQDYDVWYNRTTTPVHINYYGMSRQMLRGLANVQGHITDHLNWAAGVNFWKWNLDDMKDKGVKNEQTGKVEQYSTELTLYNLYQKIGAIKEAEAKGGTALEFNAGLVYDTRDIEAAPNKGIWAEAYLNGNVLYSPYLKACAYFRHYISIPIHIPAGEPVFAYRLAWQQTLAGETPFYMIQNIPLLVQRNMISEGFGSTGTIRGLRENRVLAEGFAWANTELRIKLVKFKLFNQYFYIATNPFFDAGIITKQYRADILNGVVNDTQLAAFKILNGMEGFGYTGKVYEPNNKLIYSAGIGLKIAMNQNFIVSAEYAHCFLGELNADPWIGIGINYQF